MIELEEYAAILWVAIVVASVWVMGVTVTILQELWMILVQGLGVVAV